MREQGLGRSPESNMRTEGLGLWLRGAMGTEALFNAKLAKAAKNTKNNKNNKNNSSP